MATVLDKPSPLSRIAGLYDYWARRTGRSQGPAMRGQGDRMLIDTLGLGLEQVVMYLGQQRPEFDAFEEWVIATAGPPDPLTVARYHAWLDREPMPEATRTHLAAIEAMPPVLDAGDLAQWERDGYVILRGAITRDEAAAAEAFLWQTIGADPGDPETWYGIKSNGIMIQVFQHPSLDVARRSPRVHKAFAQLWGTSDLWSITDRMSFNPPERPGRKFRGPNLHWDASLATPRPFATQGILYMTDTSADQGAFRLVPGMHRRLDDWLESLGEQDPRIVDLSAEAVPIAAETGDLIIWHQDLPHGASPNSTDRPRIVQYVNMYAPDLDYNTVWR